MGEYSTSIGSSAGENGIKRIPMNSVWTAVENCMAKKDYPTAISPESFRYCMSASRLQDASANTPNATNCAIRRPMF